MMDTYSTSLHERDSTLWKASAFSVAGVFLGLLTLFHETAFNMATFWWDLETYAHGFLIIPIAGWLIWGKRQHIRSLTPIPEYRALIFFGGAGFLWLLGALVNAEVVKQLALVTMLVIGLWVVLGNKVCRAIMFPLAFLYFMVPAGEDLVPVMMEFTATFTVNLLQITGIPVYREGLFFSIPSGDWSVVEACSGIRYLIASVTLGCVYAYLTYQSLSRRVIFIVISFIVPIIANGLRAYMIVMIGHLSGMELAVGVDHLIYGWLFFGLVMLILFAIGSKWREDERPVSVSGKLETIDAQIEGFPVRTTLRAGIMVICLAGIWPLLEVGISRYADVEQVGLLTASNGKFGWDRESASVWNWQPYIKGLDNEEAYFYKKNDEIVSVHLGQYLTQSQDVELVNTGNTLVAPTDNQWRQVDAQMVNVVLKGKSIKLEQSVLKGNLHRLLVWRVYRLGYDYTANPYVAKLLEVKSKLTFGRQDAAVIVLATEFGVSEADSYKQAAETLNKFVIAMLPSIEQSLDRVVGIDQ